MIAIYLLFLVGAVSVGATRLLPRARWVYQAPGLGLATWYAVLISLLVSGAGAGLTVLTSWPAAHGATCGWWAWCLGVMASGLGRALAGLAVLAIVGRAASSLARTAWDARRRRHGHADTLSIIGRSHPLLGATIVDDERPAAYVLGRGGRIVITSGALQTLPDQQVAAILAHERAHMAGRHHLLLAAARLVARTFPMVRVFTAAHRQIERLVELHADDVATRTHAPLDLARAVVTCAEAAAQPNGVPVPALAAAARGGDTLERVQRLLRPPARLSRARRFGIALGGAALVGSPVVLTAVGLAVSTMGCH